MVSDAQQFVEAFRFQFLSYLRTSRYLGMLVLTALVTVAIVGFTLYHGVATAKANFSGSSDLYFASALSFVTTLVILAASFFGGDAVATDLGSATGYFTLVLPVRRSVLLLGRYAAAFAATFSLVLVHYAILTVLALGVFGGVTVLVAESLGFATLYVLAVLSVAFPLGALFRRPVVALVGTILLIFFGFPIVQLVVEVIPYEPWFLVTYVADVISQVFTPGLTATPGLGTNFVPTAGEATGVLLGYIVIGLVLALIVYQRKEMTG